MKFRIYARRKQWWRYQWDTTQNDYKIYRSWNSEPRTWLSQMIPWLRKILKDGS